MRLLKFSRLCLLLALSALVLSGCGNMLIPTDKPLSAIPGSGDQKAAQITGCEVYASGSIQDIDADNDRLLLLNQTAAPPITYNIDLLDTSHGENRLTNFINSDRNQLAAAFDSNNNGIFYVEETSDASGRAIQQLVWTSNDKSTTRTISLPDENINAVFHIVSDNQVVYTTQDNQLVLADINGSRQSFAPEADIFLTEADYLPDSQTFIFLGRKTKNSTDYNLYRAALKADSTLDKPVLIGTHVLDFDINPDKNELLYTQAYNHTQRLMRLNLSDKRTPAVLDEGSFSKVWYTENDYILYTCYAKTDDPALQSVWTMDADGKSRWQLTPPMHLSSDVFSHNNILYFSIRKDAPNSLDNTAAVQNETYKITYSLEG